MRPQAALKATSKESLGEICRVCLQSMVQDNSSLQAERCAAASLSVHYARCICPSHTKQHLNAPTRGGFV